MANQRGSPAGAEEWLRRARRNLRIAKALLDDGYADAAAFHAQQGAELALKAPQLLQTGTFDKIHFLERLARKVAAPPRIVKLAALVSPAYTASRYPDAGRVSRKSATMILDAARRIVRWVRRQFV